MQPLLIGALVFITLFAAGFALLTRAEERELVGLRLRQIERERSPRAATLTLPFYRRALIPVVRGGIEVLTRAYPARSIEGVRANLVRAGLRRADPAAWILRKWMWTGILAGLGYALGEVIHVAPTARIAMAVLLGIMGYLTVELRLRRAIEARQRKIVKELPETLDLLTISVEAGLGLDQALSVIVRRRAGPLSEEIRQYLDEVALGKDRREALSDIGRRTGFEELISLTAMLVQSIEFGVSISNILRAQADQVRTRRRQRIEELAMKAPIKMLFPLIFLIMPAIFIVVAGPGLIRVFTELLSSNSTLLGAPPTGR
jgi:tight adherence protein C